MEPTQDLACPRCGEALGDPDLGAEIRRSGRPCSGLNGCGGVWYSHGTFAQLKQEALEAAPRNAESLPAGGSGPPPPGSPQPPNTDCPECAAPMAQRHFRFEGRATPIVLDDCETHGIWFDADELGAAIQVVRDHAGAIANHRALGIPAKSSQGPSDGPPLGPESRNRKPGRSSAAARFRKEREAAANNNPLSKKNQERGYGLADAAGELFSEIALSAIFFSLFE